ncbi:MAG: hypothetical protein Q9167_007061 [Letrouitia subvulpina]
MIDPLASLPHDVPSNLLFRETFDELGLTPMQGKQPLRGPPSPPSTSPLYADEPHKNTQCCVKGAKPPPPPPSGGGGSGADIVSAALKEKGLPYVWGGGGCKGPSKGGFDCSGNGNFYFPPFFFLLLLSTQTKKANPRGAKGLTQYAICQALNKEIPRTAQTQYHASNGKHLPRADAKPGDLIFWAEGGDCKNDVAHVGIFMRDGWMVNAAHTGTPVREQSIWTSSGGESICPDAVRFW